MNTTGLVEAAAKSLEIWKCFLAMNSLQKYFLLLTSLPPYVSNEMMKPPTDTSVMKCDQTTQKKGLIKAL